MAARVLFLAFLVALLSAQPPSSFQDLAEELASKMAAAVAAGDQATLTIVSTADADQAALLPVEAEIKRALAARGIRIIDRGERSMAFVVGCSRNLRERVCVAEARRGASNQVVVVTRPLDPRDERPTSLTVDLIPIFFQRTPILDVALAGERLLVLDPERVTFYERLETGAPSASLPELASISAGQRREIPTGRNGWHQLQSATIPRSRAWPRDVRGRLRVEGTGMTAWLPGVTCRGSADLTRFACADERGASWPIDIENTGIDAARNFFYTPEGLPFYGAAPLGAEADARWIVASTTGELLFLDAARRMLAAIASGDDVAALDPSCGSGAHVLVASTTPGDDRFDVLRLWRVVRRQLVPAAVPIAVPGRITALWSPPGASLATVVAHDISSQRYEAFHIRGACSGS